MKKNLITVTGVVLLTLFLAGCSAKNAEPTPTPTPSTKHEDGTAHTEGDSHQDESQPHTDATPHGSPSGTIKPTEVNSDTTERKPASVGEHKDTVPHGEEEPHN